MMEAGKMDKDKELLNLQMVMCMKETGMSVRNL